MKKIFAAAIMIVLFSAIARASTATVKIEWPDYEKEFVLPPDSDGQYFDVVINDLKRKYISQFPPILLGSRRVYLNDLENPTEAVIECSLLGHEKVLKVWASLSLVRGLSVIQTKIRVNGGWVSGLPGAKLAVYLLDPEKLLKEDVMVGLLLVLPTADGSLLRLKLFNNLE